MIKSLRESLGNRILLIACMTLPSTLLGGELSDIDQLMQSLMSKYNVPGSSIAVSKDGRLVYAKGYGFADTTTKERTTTKTLFRIGSVSKPIAAVTILRLVEQGKLKLSDKPYTIIGDLPLLQGYKINPEIKDITILDLLRHTSGQAVYNETGRISSPMQPPVSMKISKMYGISHSPEFKYVMGYMQSQELLNRPGDAFKYSNYGYALLGAVVEKITGESYEHYVQSNILRPIGNVCMRFGRSKRDERLPNESTYYDLDNSKPIQSIFSNAAMDSFPYAGRDYAGWGASGAWVATPTEVTRFVNHIDGLTKPALLSQSFVTKMFQRNPISEKKTGFWYGLGMRVQDKNKGQHWYHNGASNSGAAAIMLRTNNGVVWSAHFNKRLPRGRELYKEFNREMWQIIRSIQSWPSRDLFKTTKCN